METQPKMEIKTSNKFVKNMIMIVILLFIIVGFYTLISKNSVLTNGNTDQKLQLLTALKGEVFLQPRERNLSLNMATLNVIITVDFIDSIYCNVKIASAAGTIILSRKYKLPGQELEFDDPISGSIVKYNLTNIQNGDEQSFCLTDANNVMQFKAYGYTNIINLINTENSLKRNEFLYPILSPGERESGAMRIKEEHGRLIIINDPNVDKVSKINIYKMF